MEGDVSESQSEGRGEGAREGASTLELYEADLERAARWYKDQISRPSADQLTAFRAAARQFDVDPDDLRAHWLETQRGR